MCIDIIILIHVGYCKTMHILDYSKTKYCNLIGQLQVSKSYRKPVLIDWETFNHFIIPY